MVKDAKIGGRLRADVISSGAACSVSGKVGGGLDGPGSADGEEERSAVEGRENLLEVKGSFAEPADVRANLAAALAAGNAVGLFVELRVFEGREGARVAAGFKKFAVHMDDARRARLFVEIVDVLRAEEEAIAELPAESGDGLVGGIRHGGRGDAAAHGIEIPDEAGIAAPGLRRSNVFETVVAPESAGITEGGDTAFGADASAGEEEDAVGGGEGERWHW